MPTIKEIAHEANVSPSTVSKALNGRFDVNEETRKKIIAIASHRNYRASVIAKSLKSKKTESVGVIFCRESKPLSLNPFYSRVLEGIEAELALNNYNLVLHLLPRGKNVSIPKMIRDKQIDGVILIGGFDSDFIQVIREYDAKTVLVDPKVIIPDFNRVLIDNEHGAFLATNHLIQNGHTRIGFISGDLERMSFRQRLKGYKKALQFNRLEIENRFIVSGGLEDGYYHTKKLLKLRKPPTAIFSTNDINAIFSYKAVAEAELKIPDDISFVGFDDIDLAKVSSPPLTTIRVYKEEIGSIAVRKILKMLNDEENISQQTIIPTKLIERESVKTINKKLI